MNVRDSDLVQLMRQERAEIYGQDDMHKHNLTTTEISSCESDVVSLHSRDRLSPYS